MRISLIAAVAANGVIGDGSGMPWRLSTDMKRFKALTMGKPVVVGRKTFETFGKPLVGRTNIVVTGRGVYRPGEDVIFVGSLEAALAQAAEAATAAGGDEVMVIGGGEIYRAAIAKADRLYITHVAAEPAGGVLFPRIDPAVWRVVSREPVAAGEKDSAATVFTIYDRIGRSEFG